MNPFDLQGPDFLVLYVALGVTAVTVAVVLRLRDRGPSEAGESAHPLDAYQAAYLAGKGPRAFAAAIFSLVHRELLKYDPASRKLSSAGDLPRDAPPLEKAIHGAAASPEGADLGALQAAARPCLQSLRGHLLELGLIFEQKFTWQPALICFSIVVFGGIKIAVGLSRNRPVGILLFLTGLMVVAAGAVGSWVRHRTASGHLALRTLSERSSALPLTAQRRPESLNASDLALALAVALFGLGVTAAGPYSYLKRPLEASATSSGSACGGGCGGGGCGGGCGGGGCGGCGS